MGLFGKEKSAEEWHNEGDALYKLGKYDKANRCFDKAIKIDPKNADAWSSKSATLSQLRKSDEAVVCSDEAIKIDPKNADAWSNKGTAMMRLGRYEEAIPFFDEAINLSQSATAYNNKGVVLGRCKRYEEAIPFFDEAIKLEPKNLLWQVNKRGILKNITPKKEFIERKGWTESEKEQVRISQDGKCAICQKPPPRWEYDHIDGNRSNDILSNCQGLCPNCHSVKTNEE
ncbi:MAG: tetratricopeptide repeat protein [Nanoarchaeota archaeon]